MKIHEIIQRVKEVGVIAVIRAENAKKALQMAKACSEGGITLLEVTFTTPG